MRCVALRRLHLLKLAKRLGQRGQAAAYLVDAPFELRPFGFLCVNGDS